MIQLREFIENLVFCCIRCGASLEHGDATDPDPEYQVTLKRDALGLPWCEKHQMGKAVIDYGASHRWQSLDCYSFIISPGIPSYLYHLLFCSDEQIYLAEGTVELLLLNQSQESL